MSLLAAACGSEQSSADGAGGDVASASASESPDTESLTSSSQAGEETPAASTTSAADTGDDTRVVETAFGQVEIPVDPQRVIALDEYAAMNIVAVGLEPTAIVGSPFASLVSQDILADLGVAVGGQSETSGPGFFNFEAIAAAEPDVIVLTADAAQVPDVETLMEIAPAVVLPYNAPWRDVVGDTGEVFGRTDEAEQVIGALQQRIDEVSDVVADNPLSLSILGEGFGILFAVGPEGVLSAVVDEVGIDRPAAQAEGEMMPGAEPFIGISPEVIGDHDADIVAVMSGAFYREEALLDVPTYQTLPAVEAGNSVIVDGDMWFGTHPFAVFWILEDLANLAAGQGADGIGDLSDVPARWEAYQAVVG
ncbi:MAG: ABC transporter substrate-binding protein [Actinomycetota bacterium]